MSFQPKIYLKVLDDLTFQTILTVLEKDIVVINGGCLSPHTGGCLPPHTGGCSSPTGGCSSPYTDGCSSLTG